MTQDGLGHDPWQGDARVDAADPVHGGDVDHAEHEGLDDLPVDASPVGDAFGDAPPGDSGDEGFDAPEPPTTGDPDVDEAVTALARAVRGPLEEQVAAFDAAHRTLQDRLADVEG